MPPLLCLAGLMQNRILLANGKTGTTMVIFRSKWLAIRRKTRKNGVAGVSSARNTIRQQYQTVKRTRAHHLFVTYTNE